MDTADYSQGKFNHHLYKAFVAQVGKFLKHQFDGPLLETRYQEYTEGKGESGELQYDVAAIKKLVEELKAHKWTFTYIGTDHDVDSFAVSISINNCLQFNKDTQGMKSMFLKEQSSRELYSKKIRRTEDTSGDFYKE